MKYVISLNGSFVGSYSFKDTALDIAELIWCKLPEQDKKYSFVTIDECSDEVFKQYVNMGNDDDFLRDNSKLIREY